MADEQACSLGQRMFRNSSWVIVGELLNQSINFFTAILVARSLGGVQYGQWSFIYVYLSFFEMFVRFGLDSIVTRRMAVEPERTGFILGNAVLLRSGLALISFSAVLSSAFLFAQSESIRLALSLAAFQLFLGVRSLFEAVFRVRLEMGRVIGWNVLKAVINLALVAAIFMTAPDILWYVAAAFVSGFVTMTGIIFYSHRVVRADWKPDFRWMGGLLKDSAPILISGYLTLLYYRVDVFMLTVMDGFESVGHYSVATKIGEALTVIATGMMTSLFPVLSNAWQKNKAEFERLSAKTLAWLLAIGLPLAIGGMFTAKELMIVLFGEAYATSGTTLKILLWFTCVGFVSIVFTNILIVCNRQIVDTWISLGLVAANIAMNAVLIPRFSYNGAALATVFVEVIGSLAIAVYLRQKAILTWGPVLRRLPRVFAANLAFAAGLFALKFWGFNLWGLLAGGTGLYGMLVFFFKILTPEDLRYYFSYGQRKNS